LHMSLAIRGNCLARRLRTGGSGADQALRAARVAEARAACDHSGRATMRKSIPMGSLRLLLIGGALALAAFILAPRAASADPPEGRGWRRFEGGRAEDRGG